MRRRRRWTTGCASNSYPSSRPTRSWSWPAGSRRVWLASLERPAAYITLGADPAYSSPALLRLLVTAVLVWAAFWVLGWPHYYQHWPTWLVAVGCVVILPPMLVWAEQRGWVTRGLIRPHPDFIPVADYHPAGVAIEYEPHVVPKGGAAAAQPPGDQ